MKINTPMAFVFKAITTIAIVVAAAVMGGLLVILNTNQKASDTKLQAADNARVLAIIVAVTGCTVEDSMESCQAKIRVTSTAEGARRIGEVDCVTRRAIAGLPAPLPADTCIRQTPPEIYPGTPPRSNP